MAEQRAPRRRDDEAIALPSDLQQFSIPARDGWALALHGGAGGRIRELDQDARAGFEQGLRAAYDAGTEVLTAGGSALDAVCAAVAVFEDDPLFNAGRGAALNRDGFAELDAAVMSGGKAGAVAVSKHAKNPVLAARAVMDRTEHVLIVDPSPELVTQWGLETVDPEWFVTPARRAQLARLLERERLGPRHGTVGAVARDEHGHLAAATSTGGITAQATGRIGDSPIIGAGTYAHDEIVAISCTGHGEAFMRGVVAHDVAARIRYGGADLPTAIASTIAESLTAHRTSGGLVAIGADGSINVAFNSAMMFAAFDDGSLQILT